MSSLIDQEIILDVGKTLIIMKTDSSGCIKYVNNYFVKVSGYGLREIVGKNEIITRHPDMPKVVVRRIWIQLQSGKSIRTLLKNVTSNGKYYWTITEIKPEFDSSGRIASFFAKSRVLPKDKSIAIKELYKKLILIERSMGVEVSDKYLVNFLNEKGKRFDEYIIEHLPEERQHDFIGLN